MRLHIALVLALSVVPGRLRAAPFETGEVRATHARADRAVADLKKSFDGKALNDVTAFHNGAQASVASAKHPETGELVVVRQPYRPDRSNRFNNAVHKLAYELGREDLVLPSALVKLSPKQESLPADREVMIMAHAGKEFSAGNKAPVEWRERVPEETRVTAALIDFLTFQQDRLWKNLLVSEEGKVLLIDHDGSFGKGGGANHPSRFYPGEGLAFTSTESHFGELPENARRVVNRIIDSDAETLAAEYEIKVDEAKVMKSRAKRVHELGLASAIANPYPQTLLRHFSGSTEPMRIGGGDYEKRGDTVVAVPGVSKSGYMVFGPYLTFPTGHHEVEFKLRVPADATGEVGRIDVNDHDKNEVTAAQKIEASELSPGKWVTIKLPVEVTAKNELEFRVNWAGTTKLEVGEIHFR